MTSFDRRALLAALASATAMSAVSHARAAIQARPVGNVSDLRGSAFAERGPDQVSLFEKSPVLLEDLVRTGPESRCALRLGEATTIHMGESVKLRIDRFIINAAGVLTLEAGAVRVDKNDGARNQRLLLNSPYALIAIRGTSYFAGLLPDGFGVFVERGEVAVRAAGASVSLKAGEGTRIPVIGAKPEKPIVWGDHKIALARALVR
jgi:hypothetical protein